MGMTIAAEKTFQPQHITVLGVNDRSADRSLQDSDAAQDQGAHDALAKFGFRDHQRAQPPRRDDECLYGLLRNCVHQRRTARQQRQFPQKVSRAVNDERPVIAKLVALGDDDPAREDNHEARSDLADGPKRFTGSKGAQVAEPTRSLDFEQIERRINLVVPLFANGLQLRHNALPLALGRGREFITWAVVLCGTAKRGCSCLLWVKSGHSAVSERCPLYPQKQTLRSANAMSALCQKRTLERRLFDNLVGTAKQRWRYGEAECFGSLEVDDQLDGGRRLHRQIGRLLAFEDAIDISGRTTILVEIVRPGHWWLRNSKCRSRAALVGPLTQ